MPTSNPARYNVLTIGVVDSVWVLACAVAVIPTTRIVFIVVEELEHVVVLSH